MADQKGFTFIELITVIAIIGILAAIAIPNFISYRDRTYLCEGYALVEPVRKSVIDYYEVTGAMPEDNAVCGLAEPEMIKGKYVSGIFVDNGKIDIHFNDKARSYSNRTISLIPVIAKDNPTGPVVWEEKGRD